ncbi:hypothetical protein DESC_80008 [Desulfosarcina cetonica]|nr:hypothetical protein DESC_80008 [Desulfosarcina cetonica]
MTFKQQLPTVFVSIKNWRNYANNDFNQIPGGHSQADQRAPQVEAETKTDSNRERWNAYSDPADDNRIIAGDCSWCPNR